MDLSVKVQENLNISPGFFACLSFYKVAEIEMKHRNGISSSFPKYLQAKSSCTSTFQLNKQNARNGRNINTSEGAGTYQCLNPSPLFLFMLGVSMCFTHTLIFSAEVIFLKNQQYRFLACTLKTIKHQ
jgi:hypothetical protein